MHYSQLCYYGNMCNHILTKVVDIVYNMHRCTLYFDICQRESARRENNV
jgi:hypothetical protein